MTIAEKNGLKINTKLFDFVNNEIIPGTNIKSDEFWDSFGKIVHELAPINRKLIQKREDIQKKIDEWHKKNKGQKLNKKEYLEFQIKKYKLLNIHLLPYQDRKYMPAINLFADFHFIAMNKRMEHNGFPSKVYTIMSSGKPMVVVSSKNTPLVSFLEDEDPEKVKCSIEIQQLHLGDIIICDEEDNELLMIERKTPADLAASIKDGRYNEQSFRLSNYKLHNHHIIYLMEG